MEERKLRNYIDKFYIEFDLYEKEEKEGIQVKFYPVCGMCGDVMQLEDNYHNVCLNPECHNQIHEEIMEQAIKLILEKLKEITGEKKDKGGE